MRWIVEQRQAGWTWERIYFDLLRRKERMREGHEWSVSRIRRAYAAEGQLEPVRNRQRKPRPKPNLATLWLHKFLRTQPRLRPRC